MPGFVVWGAPEPFNLICSHYSLLYCKNPKEKASPIKIIFCNANTQMYYYERKLK